MPFRRSGDANKTHHTASNKSVTEPHITHPHHRADHRPPAAIPRHIEFPSNQHLQQLMSFQSTPGTAGAGTDRNKQKQTCEHSAHVRGLIPCQLHPTAMTRFPVVQCDSQVITARLQRFDSETLTIPIGSMYAIYGNIYHQYTPNVSINTSTMDPMG